MQSPEPKYYRTRAYAAATIANVSCGFDVFGIAVNHPGDTITAEARPEPGLTIRSIRGDGGLLPLETERNTAGVAAQRYLQAIGAQRGVVLDIQKDMPLKSGLGSSAASSVAAVVAVNALFGDPLSRRQLLPFVTEGERVACGSPHADNVAPALLGGFVLVRSYDPLDVIDLPVPEDLACALVHPHVEVATEAARALLGDTLSLKDGIAQWANTAGLTAGLFRADYDLISRSLHDAVAEPARSGLIPNFHDAKAAAMESGALGCGISGSGPTLFALTRGLDKAKHVAAAMAAVYSAAGMPHDTFTSTINRHGATCEILAEEETAP